MKLPEISQYPKTINIGHEEYAIRFVNIIDRDPKTLGSCDSSGIIRIKRGQSKAETFKTLIHEVMHAIEYTYELKIDHQLIHKLEGPIVDLLMTNF